MGRDLVALGQDCGQYHQVWTVTAQQLVNHKPDGVTAAFEFTVIGATANDPLYLFLITIYLFMVSAILRSPGPVGSGSGNAFNA
jgi:hypothetical protein